MCCLFLPHKQQRKGSICVSVIPYSKSQLLAGPLRVQAEEYSPWRIQPSFCVDFNRFATLQRFYMPLQVLFCTRQNWGEQHRSYKLLQCKHFFICHITQHYVAFDFWIDSRSGETLVTHHSSHRRTAKLSGLSGFKPCAALNRNGMAKAARAGHTQRYAKLAAEIAKHRKLQECKVFTWPFVRRKTAQVVVGSNFEPLGLGGTTWPHQQKNHIPW